MEGQCPDCKRSYEISDEFIAMGGKAKCPHCLLELVFSDPPEGGDQGHFLKCNLHNDLYRTGHVPYPFQTFCTTYSSTDAFLRTFSPCVSASHAVSYKSIHRLIHMITSFCSSYSSSSCIICSLSSHFDSLNQFLSKHSLNLNLAL